MFFLTEQQNIHFCNVGINPADLNFGEILAESFGKGFSHSIASRFTVMMGFIVRLEYFKRQQRR
jgi:hypothetical protein